MKSKIDAILKLAACDAVVITVAQISAPAMAGSAADAIKERRALMKSNAGHMRAIAGFVKKGKGSAAEAARHAEGLAANAAKIAGLYPKGTSAADGVGQTRAKPAIWTERGKFEAFANNLKTAAMGFTATAGSGDKKAMGMAMGGIGKNCGGCHRAFRAPKKKK